MIKLIKNTFYEEKKTQAALAEFITRAEYLSFGPECQKFETQFAKVQYRNHCVAVNSGSSANLALIQTLLNLGKLKPGDRVGFSAVTWSTNVMPLFQLGLIPVPIDVELDTLNVSSSTLRNTLKTIPLKALFLTNLLGFCDDLEKIVEICHENNILLIEDNCESLGSVYQGKKLGNFGIASTFSFYVGHHMSTIEGGAICTNDEEISQMLQIVRAHGWDRNLSNQNQSKIRAEHQVNSTFYSRYTFYDLGYNFRPTEIVGFLGQNQLQYLDQIIKVRQNNFLKLAKIIYTDPRFHPITFDHLDIISNFAVPVICKNQQTKDELVKKCDNILEIRPIVGGNLVKQPFYQKYQPEKHATPNADIIHQNGLYFGNNPDLTNDELNQIINIFS